MGSYKDPQPPALTLKFIDGTPSTSWSTVKYMGIDHRCFHVFMTKEFLYCPFNTINRLKTHILLCLKWIRVKKNILWLEIWLKKPDTMRISPPWQNYRYHYIFDDVRNRSAVVFFPVFSHFKTLIIPKRSQ